MQAIYPKIESDLQIIGTAEQHEEWQRSWQAREPKLISRENEDNDVTELVDARTNKEIEGSWEQRELVTNKVFYFIDFFRHRFVEILPKTFCNIIIANTGDELYIKIISSYRKALNYITEFYQTHFVDSFVHFFRICKI